MRSVLIGYMAKQRLTRAGWISPWADHPDCGFPCGHPVEEIGSVSHCMARNYRDPADSGAENPFCLFDDPEVAWGMVPSESRGRAALFAYRLWPIQFEEGNQEEIDLWWEPALGPLPDTFACLGWDAVVGGKSALLWLLTALLQQRFRCRPLPRTESLLPRG